MFQQKMISKINIIDYFYSKDDFENLLGQSNTIEYEKTHQPKMIPYPDRMKAMPCYETKMMTSDIFKNTFEEKTKLQIENFGTFFRKTLGEEIKQSGFYNAGSPPHTDNNNFDIAGLIYFNTFDINDGTKLYSFKEQYEPDIIVGSKPNRMIYYNADVLHTANYNVNINERIVQPFFIKLKGGK